MSPGPKGPLTGAEFAAELERAQDDVANAVREIEGEIVETTLRGERVAAMPVEAWEQVKEALDVWHRASKALLVGDGQ